MVGLPPNPTLLDRDTPPHFKNHDLHSGLYIEKEIYRKYLILHLITAAKLCIPTHWKATSPPSIPEWLCRVGRIAEMEDLIHQAKDTSPKFHKIWACWLHFKESAEYSSLLETP